MYIRSQGEAGGLLVSFFGLDQKGKLSLKSFRAFLGELHDELIKLEFQHYLPDVSIQTCGSVGEQ